LVCYVPPGSLADAAGFKPGDIIVSVGLHPVKSLKDVKDKLNQSQAGNRVEFLI
jgi:S1-C subfamily serine protease